VLDCESLPSDIVIHRENVDTSRRDSHRDIWLEALKRSVTVGTKIAKNPYKAYDADGLSVNLIYWPSNESNYYNTYLKTSQCYQTAANNLKGFAIMIDTKNPGLTYNRSGEKSDKYPGITAHANLFPLPGQTVDSAWDTFNRARWTACWQGSKDVDLTTISQSPKETLSLTVSGIQISELGSLLNAKHESDKCRLVCSHLTPINHTESE
jgi:hypothetical protein